MVRTLTVFMALVVAGRANAGIESQQLHKVQALRIEVRSVKSCGTWEVDGRSGHYRLVIADVYNGAGSELYVQWVIDATQEKAAVVLQTVPIRELNDDHSQYDFLSVDCERKGKASYVRARAHFEHDERPKVHVFAIRLLGVGRYELKEQ